MSLANRRICGTRVADHDSDECVAGCHVEGKSGKSICQYGDARGYRLRRSILVGTVTDAVAARNEEHRNRCNPGHEERIMVGPAYHTAVSNTPLIARRG